MDYFERPEACGDVAFLMQTTDWAASPLGPPEDWSSCLKATLDLMFPSQAQIVLFWGPEFIAFYNDAYVPTIGDKHPAAFGRPARENWSELWDDLEPLLSRVLYGRETVAAKDRPFYIERGAHPERVYFDISYSPVCDTDGTVHGVFCVVSETTGRVNLEQNLKKSQDQLNCALDAAGMVGIFDWDIRTDSVQGDVRFAELFSIDPAYAQEGVPMALLIRGIHPDDRKRVWEAIQQIKTTGQKFAEEYRVLSADGTVRWIDAQGKCLYGEGGEPLRFAGAVIDITARKRTEDALRESEARLSAIFSQTTGGIAQTDVTGRFVFVNDRYSEIVGYSKEELLHKRMQDITHPDDLARNLELFTRMAETGESFGIEKRYMRKDGSVVWVNNSVAPIRDRSGAIVEAVATVVDITQRKQAEEHVIQLAAIIASSDDAIISTDLNLVIRSWNDGAARLYGYSAEEIIGKSATELLPRDRVQESARIIQLIARGERVETHETRRRRKDGTLIDVSLTVSPIFDEYGRITGASKIARDITARKEAERLTRVLMGELKHRVKNVLATVQAIARQTFGRYDSNPTAIETFTARLAALARAHDLLTRESWEEAELSAIVHETLAPYARQRFTIEGPALRLRPRSVVAMSLALHELATNAAKYGALSAPAGHITVSWAIEPEGDGHFELVWEERGGPQVSVPDEKGFGSKLITHILAAELGGSVQIDYDPSGIRCRVTAPLETDAAES